MGGTAGRAALGLLGAGGWPVAEGASRGSSWCWGDETFHYRRKDCCQDGGQCFATQFLTPVGGVVAGTSWGVFNKAKCCEWTPNRSSFYGFVNPSHYLIKATEYSRYPGMYLPGYARSDETERSFEETRELCDRLAGSCAGFTCDAAEASCSVRGGGTLSKSPWGEVSYRKESAASRGEYLQMLLDQIALRLPAPGAPPVWTLSHSDAELPRQVAWEVMRFREHEAEFQAVFEARRKRHRHGYHSCHKQFDTHKLFVLSSSALMLHLRRLLSWRNVPETRFVNLGANDGIGDDPLGPMLQEMPLVSAVAVERDPALCTLHKANLPHVHLWCGAVTPPTALEALEDWVPWNDPDVQERGVLRVDVLKIDIDSYDCALLEAYLAGVFSERLGEKLRLQPSIILSEVNDGIPPPVQQALLFDPALLNVSFESPECSGNIPVSGCSLSYQVKQMARFGYSLLMYASGNAVFAHESVVPKLAEAGIDGPVDEFECYWHTIVSAQCVSGRQLRRWFHEAGGPATARGVLQEIRDHLKGLERHFNLPPLPLVLEV